LLSATWVVPLPTPPGPSVFQTSWPLPRSEFAEAVKAALETLGGKGGLTDNPLLESRLVVGAGEGEPPSAPEKVLAERITAAIEQLEATPGPAAEHGRVLRAAYLRGDPA